MMLGLPYVPSFQEFSFSLSLPLPSSSLLPSVMSGRVENLGCSQFSDDPLVRPDQRLQLGVKKPTSSKEMAATSI